MPLNTDSEYKVLLLGGIHRIHDVLDQDIVLGPSVFRHLEDIHEFLAGIAVKSDIIEHLCPAVEVPAVIMKRVRPVSQLG